MNTILLHPYSHKAFDNFIANPSHAVIIDGPIGAGKTTAATYLASNILGLDNLDLDNNSKVRHLSPINGSIAIEDIRNIQEFVKLKTLGEDSIKRIIVIEQADTLTREAQNSLLKLLEEPPSDTVIVLTTGNLTALLPTIRSRSQIIRLKTPTRQDLNDYFGQQDYDKAAIDKAFYISQGRVGLMQTILNGDSTELLEQIDLAKQVLAMSQFERLVQADVLAKQKESLSLFLQALETVCQAGLSQASDNDRTNQVKRWHKSLASTVEAQSKLNKQTNTKLLMTDLMLNL